MVKEKPVKPTRVKKESTHPTSAAIKKLYTKSAPMLMFEALLFIVAAVIIFIKPVSILATVTVLFGIVLAFLGLYQLFVGLFGGETDMSGKTWNIILGLAKLILGVIFFFQPAGSMITVIYIFAILFLIKAISTFVFAIRMLRAKFGSILDLLTSIIMIALGILVLFFPTFGVVTTMYFVAITLIFYAIADLVMYSKLLKLKKMAD